MNTQRAVPRSRRTGFSLAEVLIALTVSVVVVSAAVQMSVGMWKGRRGWTVREGVDRNARFVGLSLGRDVAEAGVGVESGTAFASVNGLGDTLTILSVPFAPDEAIVYSMQKADDDDDDDDDEDTDDEDCFVMGAGGNAAAGAGGQGQVAAYDSDDDDDDDEDDDDEDEDEDDSLLPPGGSCGATCIDFYLNGSALELKAGDVAQLRVGQARRLLLLSSVKTVSSNRFQVTFADVPSLANRPSGLSGLRLRRSETSLQKVVTVMYWRNAASKTLFRATSFLADGRPDGKELASPVDGFEARVRFTSGVQASSYNGTDADTTNDGNDIIGVTVRAKMRAERADPSVNGGNPVSQWYQWRMAPRNLLYEKNRQ